MIHLKALDRAKALIGTLEYINLQWTRRYYTSGEFSVLVPLNKYTLEMEYLYSPDRPEMGMIQKREITQSVNGELIQLSGFFIEKQLDDKIIHPVFNFYGNIEDGARQLFDTYKGDIQGVSGTRKGLGSTIQFQETGAELGMRIYELLETQELSYSMRYDYLQNKTVFDVWQGVDRTDTQTINNRVVFSRKLGNARDLKSIYDDSGYKNYAVIAGEGEGAARKVVVLDASNGGYKRKLFVDAKDIRQEDLTAVQYEAALRQRGAEKLLEYQIITDFDMEIDPHKKGREYITDWNLGDKCDVIVSMGEDVEMVYTARITEIEEVVKNNNWEVRITVGNKTPSILQKARR
ncbi:MAG: siphovirus ReqiPepy6 Gp37-like family protein [Christensenella sp.]